MELKKNNLKILYSIILNKLNQHFIKKGKKISINLKLKKYLLSLKKKQINIILFIYLFIKNNNIYLKNIKKKNKINIKTMSKIKQLNNILKNIKTIQSLNNKNIINKIDFYKDIEKNKYNIK